MGETLGISHNVFEKAERERDRKERLKALEDWKKEKNIRLKRASLYANKHRTQSAQLAAALAAKHSSISSIGELPSRSSVVSLPNDHGHRGGGDVGGGGGGGGGEAVFKEEEDVKERDGEVGTEEAEAGSDVSRKKSGSTKSTTSEKGGRRRTASSSASQQQQQEEKDGETSCTCVIL